MVLKNLNDGRGYLRISGLKGLTYQGGISDLVSLLFYVLFAMKNTFVLSIHVVTFLEWLFSEIVIFFGYYMPLLIFQIESVTLYLLLCFFVCDT